MGQVMKDYCELMDVYKAFVARTTARRETIDRLKTENPKFKAFLQTSAQAAGGHGLESLIHSPIQR